MLPYGRAERRVGGHPGLVERRHVELDEPPALLFGDLQTAVHGDEGAAINDDRARAGSRIREAIHTFTAASPARSSQDELACASEISLVP